MNFHMHHNQHTKTNTAHDYYTCPMHPEIKQDKPGTCPKCGGMELVKQSTTKESTESMYHDRMEMAYEPMEHDHANMMASPQAAADFLKRFYIVTVLLIPLALFSTPAVHFLGVPDFPFRSLVEFSIATIIFYFGLIFFKHAKMEIQMKQYGMMTLVSLGIGAGYLFSVASTFIPTIHTEFYLEIATLIWVLLFGHFLEAKSSTAAGDALKEVAKLLPKEAHLKTKNGMHDVALESLNEGDIVLVKPGEKVPADGTIIKGSSHFNEAHITGESRPVERKVGMDVVAGAINNDGSVDVKLMRVGASSTIGQIQKLIATAKQTKPSAERLADRAAKWLTLIAVTVSIVTLFVWSVVIGQPFVFATTLAITVLVITCPHALGLAIPTVSTIATRMAIKNGVFIKDLGKIEVIKKADYVVFDKTGTLTHGKFGVTDVHVFTGDKKKLLHIAGAIESQSSHVIGAAIIAHLKEKKLPIGEASHSKNLAGKGIEGMVNKKHYLLGNKRLMEEKKVWTKEAEHTFSEFATQGKTPVFVADTKTVLGIIALSDQIKKEAKQAIKELHALGVKVAMLTGDTIEAAESIAKVLGIDTVFAEVLPEDKYKHIRSLQEKGNVIIMAGDGVNDAPALTQADAGVAIGAGTDVAIESGDIVLTQSNPQHIVRLLVLSRKVYRKMIENLWWALGYNIVAIPAAAGVFVSFGFRLNPAVGALAMSLSSVIVVMNALSLRKAKLTINA